jgi:carboxyl-terminal processing protease
VDGEPIELAGIGAAISWRKDRLVVQGVVPGSPAEIAGVVPADEITEIDGFATRGRGLGAGVEDIRGVAGTSVRLRITRKGVDPFQLDIVRATVRYAGQE